MKKQLLFILSVLLALPLKAGPGPAFVALADGHRIYFDSANWDYALSERTFQKTLPLLEHRNISGLRGVFENEVRFISKRSPAAIGELLGKECQKAQKFYEDDDYEVIQSGRHCIVQTRAAHTLPRSMYQVIEAKVSRSRSDMFFFYTWTFHFPKKSAPQARAAIDELVKKENKS